MPPHPPGTPQLPRASKRPRRRSPGRKLTKILRWSYTPCPGWVDLESLHRDARGLRRFTFSDLVQAAERSQHRGDLRFYVREHHGRVEIALREHLRANRRGEAPAAPVPHPGEDSSGSDSWIDVEVPATAAYPDPGQTPGGAGSPSAAGSIGLPPIMVAPVTVGDPAPVQASGAGSQSAAGPLGVPMGGSETAGAEGDGPASRGDVDIPP